MTSDPVAVEVRVVLPEPEVAESVAHEAIEGALRAVVAQLDLPVRATVRIVPGERLLVDIGGTECAAAWAAARLRDSGAVLPRAVETLHRHAHLLITPAVAASVWASVRPDEPPPWFGDLLRELVRHRVRVGSRVAPMLAAGTALDPAEMFETALSAARGPVRIVLDAATSETWIEDDLNTKELLVFLAVAMFDELGLPLAVPQLVTDPMLPDHHFAVEVNDLRTPPMPGLRSDQILVNDTQERLAVLDVEAEAATNPATGYPAAVTAATQQSSLEAGGYTVWTMSGCVILAAAEVVRCHAAALYHAPHLAYQSTRLAADLPLLQPMIDAFGAAPLIRILRGLLRERVPVDDLYTIVAALHRAGPPPPTRPDMVVVPLQHHRPEVVAAHETGDPLEAAHVETARGALSTRIVNKFTRGTSTLVVYLVDPAIERRLRDPAAFTTEERRDLLDMVRDELAHIPSTAQRPVVLTRAAIRGRLYGLLADALPALVVVAYEELPGDLNVQPVARLSIR